MRIIPLLFFLLCASVAMAQEAAVTPDPEMQLILKKIEVLTPKETDFQFHAPQSWGKNLLSSARIVKISAGESMEKAGLIIDALPATTWVSARYSPPPVITIDLGHKIKFNRIVIFNRHTDSRGTAGGNNAAKRVTIDVSSSEKESGLKLLKEITVEGPNAMCFKKGKGQICFFIDNTKPQIFEVKKTTARLLRITFNTAHWGEVAIEDWKTSLAFSEIMLFKGPTR